MLTWEGNLNKKLNKTENSQWIDFNGPLWVFSISMLPIGGASQIKAGRMDHIYGGNIQGGSIAISR